jgi:hypothetical protein
MDSLKNILWYLDTSSGWSFLTNLPVEQNDTFTPVAFPVSASGAHIPATKAKRI